MNNSPQESKDYKQDVLSLIWSPGELSPFAVYFVVILATPSQVKIKHLKSRLFSIILTEEFPPFFQLLFLTMLTTTKFSPTDLIISLLKTVTPYHFISQI